jgi:hypothetical protein
MDVGRIVEALGLDPARIVAKASATADYARILTERAAEARGAASEGWLLRAAGAQTIAGSTWMLVYPPEAIVPLGHAEDTHDRIGSAYGSLLGICAHPRRPAPAQRLPLDVWGGPQAEPSGYVEREQPSGANAPFPRLQPAASLLAHLWPLAAGQTDQSLERLLSDAPVLDALPGSWRTGRLRIPLAHYRGIAREVDRLRHGEYRVASPRRDSLPATAAFVERAAEAIGAVRENAHQWRTLRSPILPVEPEVLAACTLVELTARDALGVTTVEATGVPTDGLAGALLGVAENLLDTDANSGPTPEVAR